MNKLSYELLNNNIFKHYGTREDDAYCNYSKQKFDFVFLKNKLDIGSHYINNYTSTINSDDKFYQVEFVIKDCFTDVLYVNKIVTTGFNHNCEFKFFMNFNEIDIDVFNAEKEMLYDLIFSCDSIRFSIQKNISSVYRHPDLTMLMFQLLNLEKDECINIYNILENYINGSRMHFNNIMDYNKCGEDVELNLLLD